MTFAKHSPQQGLVCTARVLFANHATVGFNKSTLSFVDSLQSKNAPQALSGVTLHGERPPRNGTRRGALRRLLGSLTGDLLRGTRLPRLLLLLPHARAAVTESK